MVECTHKFITNLLRGKLIKTYFFRLLAVISIGIVLFTTAQMMGRVKPFKIQELLEQNHPIRVGYEKYKEKLLKIV